MLRLSGVPFEDIQFTHDEWLDKYQSRSPAGLCPWLELDNGTTLTESLAIHIYCGELAGFLPRKGSMPMHLALARTVELHSVFEDVRFHNHPTSSDCVPFATFCSRRAAL